VVIHQLQVERRTGKVRQSETDVLPLCHAPAIEIIAIVRILIARAIIGALQVMVYHHQISDIDKLKRMLMDCQVQLSQGTSK